MIKILYEDSVDPIFHAAYTVLCMVLVEVLENKA